MVTVPRRPWQWPTAGATIGDVTQRARVLVVDDEPSIVDAVATALGYAGFDVTRADGGMAALAHATDTSQDAIVLDVMMPDLDGIEVCRRLRALDIETPILFLTAKADLGDKVIALRAGGDDYVVKPFSLVEVVARVQAMTRRSRARRRTPEVLAYADVRMTVAAHQAFRGPNELHLTATEFRLLRYFLTNPGLTLTKDQILAAVWTPDFDGPVNIVETYVSYLRRKLNEHGPPLLHTVRLVGYVLREAESER